MRTGANVPAWMVFDARFRRKYPCGPIMPASMMPDSRIPAAFRDVIVKADTIDALAARIGVDAAGLHDTLRDMARYAATGIDEAFGKGDNLFDTYYGDPRNKPNPCLGPVDQAPFYAVRIDAGDIGTKGGHRRARPRAARRRRADRRPLCDRQHQRLDDGRELPRRGRRSVRR